MINSVMWLKNKPFVCWATIGSAKTQGQATSTTVYTQPGNNTNQKIINHMTL